MITAKSHEGIKIKDLKIKKTWIKGLKVWVVEYHKLGMMHLKECQNKKEAFKFIKELI